MSVGSFRQDLIEKLCSVFLFVCQFDVQSFEVVWDLLRALSKHSWDDFPQKIDESFQNWITRTVFQSTAEVSVTDAEDQTPSTG
jgi:hypothetical protein